MRNKKRILFLAFCMVLIVFLDDLASDYSTSSDISMSRSISDTTSMPGEEISIAIFVRFNNISNSARGLYITDNIPDSLMDSFTTFSVELSGIDITSTVTTERDSSGSVYEGTTPVRWILETPPWFTENLPANANDSVVVKYKITIPPNAPDSTVYSFPNAQWVTVIDPLGTPLYEFGYEELPNLKLMVSIQPPVTRADIDRKIKDLKDGIIMSTEVRNLIDRYMHGK